MRIVFKLVLANAWQHPARIVLTSLSVIAATCVVVWVVSGYDALLGQFDQFAPQYLGRYELVVVPQSPGKPVGPGRAVGPPICEELLASMKQDAAVATVNPVTQSRVTVARPGASGSRAEPAGSDPAAAAPQTVHQRRGVSGTASQQGSAALRRPGPVAKGSKKTRPGRRAADGPGVRRPKRGFWRPRPTLEGTDAARPPYEMAEGVWINPGPPDRMQAALSSRTAEQLEIRVGDDLPVESTVGKFRLKIVGLVEQVAMGGGSGGPRGLMGPSRGPATSALYVPVALAERISGKAAEISYLNVDLREGVDVAQFRAKWLSHIAQHQYPATILAPGDVETELKEGFMAARARNQAYAATGISLLAALFIILTTLSMGVHERIRQFAVLRAVALTRVQVGWMIAVESLVLAVIGWLGGLAAGWGLLWIIGSARPGPSSGAALGPLAVLLSGLCAFGGALAASILPAFRAMRISPLEAMAPHRAAPAVRLSAAAAALGFVLIAVNPLLVFVVPMADSARYGVYAALGCTSMAIGFVLLVPLAILATERFLGPLVAGLLRLDGRLLRTQLSSNLWRTWGTTVALSLGLGLYVAMQTWGYSMLEPFKPGNWVPDVLVSFQRGGLPDAEIATVRAVEGVRADRCIPLAVEQPKLAEDVTGSQQRDTVTRQDNVIMIGLDPQVAFGGPDPLVKAHFIEATPEEAIAKLKQGPNCIVPDHFLSATNLKLGDRFSMIPPDSPGKRVEYTIVGAMSLPGWHWMTKFSGLRRREGRSAAMVFADYGQVWRDFGLSQINFFWLDVDEEFGQEHLEEVRKAEAAKKAAAAAEGNSANRPPRMRVDLVIDAKRAAVVKIGEALQPIADRNMGEEQPVNMQGRWSFGATMFGQSVRTCTPDEVHTEIMARASGMIWASCYLPLITLLVTSLGVVNAVMASVRARRWEFGVLRSQGVTRSGLLRMILAEGLLIGLITCLLSLGFGVFSGWCGTGISQYVSFFGGLAPPLVIPWAQLSVGFGMALGLCLLAALWPAISTGRAEPLQLLQAGRAAM